MKQAAHDFYLELKEQIKIYKKEGIKKQIPNLLTFSRALAPLIVIPTIILGYVYLAIVELIIFEATDFLDGRLARKYNCVSEFGLKLDAICDKVFALGIMIPAIMKFPILIINLLLEVCISYINFTSFIKNNHPKSNSLGKTKTILLSITLILAYIPYVIDLYVLMASILTFMLQIGAFIEYRESDISKDKEKEK